MELPACGSLCGETASQYQAKGGLNAPEAWDILKRRGAAYGRGARVAVLDTGVAYLNQKHKFRRSPDFSRDQFLPGYDFVDKDRMPLDEDGHGTHATAERRAGQRESRSPASPRRRRSSRFGCSTSRASELPGTSLAGFGMRPPTRPR